MTLFLKYKECYISLGLTILLSLMNFVVTSQITLAFQGGETADTWSYTSTGASSLALTQALSTQNKITGTKSLVVGGNTGGGNCFDSKSGNGPSVARTFTFSPIDVSTSSNYVRTLKFNWGNRYPVCVGTGWDTDENLVFTAYHDGVAQAPVTLAVGVSNAVFSIHNNQCIWSIPTCVNSFSFEVSVTTNREDELLFIDDVILTTPQLNAITGAPQLITNNTTICEGAIESYRVVQQTGVAYTWSGLPATATFTAPNGTVNSHTISVNWGSTPSGTYTFNVTPSTPCSGNGTPTAVTVTITQTPSYSITGNNSMCSGESITLTSSSTTGNTWSVGGQTTQSIVVSSPGTYSVTIQSPSCGTQVVSHVISMKATPQISSVVKTDISCFGENDASIIINSSDINLEYSLDGVNYVVTNNFPNLNAGNHRLWVKKLNGCSIELPAEVISAPTEVVAMSSNTGAYCQGDQILLLGNTQSTGNLSFSWTGPNGYNSSVQNPTNAIEAGNYFLTVVANGCTSQPSLTSVIINNTPIVSVANSGPYCTGDVVQLTSLTSNPANSTFLWSGPNGFSSSVQNPQGIFNAGVYSLIVSENGCNSASQQTTVLINPVPTVQASFISPFCPGTILQLTSNSSVASSNFLWSGPNSYTSVQQNPTDATDVGRYELLVNANGCTSQPVYVDVVHDIPTLTVTNSGPFCEGQTIGLFGTTSAIGNVSWSWVGPNGYTSTDQNPTDVIEAGNYSLTININNCVSTKATDIVINPKPIANFTATSPCLNDATVFSSSSSTVVLPESIVNWNWSFGDGKSSNDPNPLHVYQAQGIYNVTLTVKTANNCSHSITQPITVLDAPIADFRYNPTEISTLDPQVEFVNLSQNAISYHWIFDNDGSESFEVSPEFTYPDNEEDYQVVLVAINDKGCSDTIRKIISIKEQLTYYIPNSFTPDGNEFNQYFLPVFTAGIDESSYRLLIYNRWGEIIFESHDLSIGWDGTYKGQKVQEGVYTWNIHVKHKVDDGHENLVGNVNLLR